MNKTNIEYLDLSWNPIAMRCTPVGAGCKNCWHLAMADRLAANPSIPEDLREAYAGGPPVLVESRLDAPLRRKKPARIGTQFMGDLFCADVPDDFIDCVFGVMSIATKHTFVVLTKRPDRILEWMDGLPKNPVSRFKGALILNGWDFFDHRLLGGFDQWTWPLPNVHFGVSVSTQDDADRNIPEPLLTSAAVRIVSVEPMLERIDPVAILRTYEWIEETSPSGKQLWKCRVCGDISQAPCKYPYHKCRPLDWVIIGCESGPNRRPMELEWAVDLVSQCKAAGVAVFVKQIEVNGKVSHDPAEWDPVLQVREYPDARD